MRIVSVIFVLAGWLLAASASFAHHSFAAVFDINRPIDFTGTVTRLEWTNPHAWIHVAVEDADGGVQSWSIELLGINTLLKQGWTPGILNPGDAINVKGYGARDGSTSANASVVTLIDTGEELWVSESRENIN
ncbi:MAG: DUF6152 family protein [Gammaproteobacteria bacterium]